MSLEPVPNPIIVSLTPSDRVADLSVVGLSSGAPTGAPNAIPNPESLGAAPVLGDFSVHMAPSGRLELLVLQLATAELPRALGHQPFGKSLFDEAARLIGPQSAIERQTLVAVLGYRSLTSEIAGEHGKESPVHRIFVSVLMELDPIPVSALPALVRLSFLEPTSTAGKGSTNLLNDRFPVEYREVARLWNSWSQLSPDNKRSFLFDLRSSDTLPLPTFLFIQLAIEAGSKDSDETIVAVGSEVINSHAHGVSKAHRPMLIAPALALASRHSHGTYGLRNMQQGCETLAQAGAAAEGVTSVLRHFAEDGPSPLRLNCARTMLLLNPDGVGDAVRVLFESNPDASPRDLVLAMVMLTNLVDQLPFGTLAALQISVEQFLLHENRTVLARTATLIATCEAAMDAHTAQEYLRDGTAA